MRQVLVLSMLAAAIAAGACSDSHFGGPVGKPVSEADFPHIGQGYWQSTMTATFYAHGIIARPEGVMTGHGCHLSDSMLPAKDGACSRFAIGQAPGGAFVADIDCVNHGNRMRGHETFRGDFARHFTQDLWSSIDIGDGVPPDLRHAVTEWTYVGPCPAGTEAEHWLH